MTTLPAIFTPTDEYVRSIDTRIQGNTRWVEFVAHIAQFRDLDPPHTREHLNQLLKSEGDPIQRAVLVTGIARCYIHEGYFLKGAQTLGYAYSLLPESNTDERAFILLEMIAFLAINGQHDLSLLLLERIPHLTSIPYLLRLADYYRAVHRIRSGSLEDVQQLLESLKYFEKIQLHSTVAYHYKNIGNVYRKYKEYDLAQDYYSRGTRLCLQHNYRHIESAIIHDIAMLHFYKGDSQTGMQKMDEALELADNHYTRAFIFLNKGYIQFKGDQFKGAIPDLQRSLNIIVQHGIHHMIPSAAYYLAECHRKLDNTDLSGYFYQKAYEAAFELLKQHFPFSGDRLLAMQGYYQYLVDHQQASTAKPEGNEFNFALNKSLKEIRGIFQNTLIDIIVQQTGTITAAAKHLDISMRSIHTARSRNREYAITDPPASVIKFISEHKDLSWRQVNTQFEESVLSYLYMAYGANKKILSRKLDISYTRTLQLTAGMSLTQYHS